MFPRESGKGRGAGRVEEGGEEQEMKRW